uniref:uncharacterized protein LOC120334150 n=1 Tax=Styela clava TaxID=7725 RepID=UPI001939F5EF|nr:uncharacterized protein LOC120334150 [Styela clava]
MLVSVTMAVAIEESEPFRKVEIVADGGNYAPDVRKIRKEKIPAIGCISLKSAKRFLLFFDLANQAVNDYLLSLSSAGEFNPEIPDQEPPTFLDIQSLTKLYTGTGDLPPGNMINTLMRQSNVKLSPYVNSIQKQQFSNSEIFAMALFPGAKSKYSQLIIQLQALGPHFSQKICEWILCLFKLMMQNLGNCASVISPGIMTIVEECKGEPFSQWIENNAFTFLCVQGRDSQDTSLNMLCQQQVGSEFFQHPITSRRDCPLARGEECGNIPIQSLFGKSEQLKTQGQEEVLQQKDPNTGKVLRTVRYPADLPERIRQTGGIFEIGPNNTIRIQTGPGQNTGNVGAHVARAPQPIRWRMANVISSDHRRFLTNLHLHRELDRLASFARWPVGQPNVSPTALARTGFFYLGDMDRTQCFSCGGVLRNWTVEDDALAEHRSHFPNCKMVLGTEHRNNPVNKFADPPADRAINYPCRFPSNPHMRNEVARQATFDHRWSVGRTAATPSEISQAGFFFLGERDRVKCWYCNGGLQNWEYDDIPWNEHAKWFPTCQFLLQVKGQHFVYRQSTMNHHLARPIITKQDGATVDPGDVGGGSSQGNVDTLPSGPIDRQPEPTPEIIDPQFQAEMRKRKERVKTTTEKSDLVKNILLMGFDKKVVAALLEDNIESGNVANPDDIYDSMSSLLDDVTKKEKEIEEEECQMQAAAQIPAVRNKQPSKTEKERMCKICFSNPADMAFISCSHMICCMECTQAIKQCPICRKKIEKTIKSEEATITEPTMFIKEKPPSQNYAPAPSGGEENDENLPPEENEDSPDEEEGAVAAPNVVVVPPQHKNPAGSIGQREGLINPWPPESDVMLGANYQQPAPSVEGNEENPPPENIEGSPEEEEVVAVAEVVVPPDEPCSIGQREGLINPWPPESDVMPGANYQQPVPSVEGNEENPPPENIEGSPEEEEVVAVAEVVVPPDEPCGQVQPEVFIDPVPPEMDVIPPESNYQQPPQHPAPIPYEAKLTSLQNNPHFRNNLTPTPHEFARAGFYGEGNQITCAECGSQHPLDHLVNRPSKNIVWHLDNCPFYNRRRPCGYCTPNSIGEHSLDECVKCSQLPEIMMAFSELEEYFQQDPEMPQEADIRAFADLQCVICHNAIPNRQNQDVCLVCSGVVCEDCVDAYHGH